MRRPIILLISETFSAFVPEQDELYLVHTVKTFKEFQKRILASPTVRGNGSQTHVLAFSVVFAE
jgi:hypothetical protein